MKKFYQSIPILFLGAIFFVAGLLFGQSRATAPIVPVLEPAGEAREAVFAPVSVMIDEGTDDLKIYTGVPAKKGDTVFSVLETLSKGENGFDLRYDPPGEWGVFVKKVASKENGENGKYWQYFVNNAQPQVSSDRYELKGGETILWKFMASKY